MLNMIIRRCAIALGLSLVACQPDTGIVNSDQSSSANEAPSQSSDPTNATTPREREAERQNKEDRDSTPGGPLL